MTDEIWTIKRILEWIEGYLAKHGDAAPRASAQWLVSEAIGISRMQLFLDAERPLTAEERGVLRDWTRRRGAGEPLQYITGTVGFRHIVVNVRPGVLIPRPETEVLVSEALALLPVAPKPQDEYEATLARQFAEREEGEEANEDEGAGSAHNSDADTANTRQLLIADICTGSGCIACSIAHEHPLTRVIATDIAPEAVALARENARNLGLEDRITIIECNLGEGIENTLMGSFDLVVSNPPYVPTNVLADIPREVADFEPTLALDGGADGLDVFRRLLSWCRVALKPGGAFAFELHETTLGDAATLAGQTGFSEMRIVNDLAGKPRILTACKTLTCSDKES